MVHYATKDKYRHVNQMSCNNAYKEVQRFCEIRSMYHHWTQIMRSHFKLVVYFTINLISRGRTPDPFQLCGHQR